MSNELFLDDTRFHISPDKEEAARVALVQVAEKRVGTKNWRAGDIKEMAEGRECDVTEFTLDDLVQCWGWSLVRDIANRTNEIIDIDLLEDFSSDEETLFETLAPFVTAGSFIDLDGKSTGGDFQKRYGFTGKRVVELEKVYPAIPIEE